MDTTHSLFRTRATNSYIKAFAADKHVMSQRLVGVLRVAYKAKQLFHIFLGKYFPQDMSFIVSGVVIHVEVTIKSKKCRREEVDKLKCSSWVPVVLEFHVVQSNPCRSMKSNSIHSNYISKENSHPRPTVESTIVLSSSKSSRWRWFG